jgi:serine/threonine protein phosphatase PrpC
MQQPGSQPDYARASQRGDRKINQDRCEVFQHDGIIVLVLADGMGGHPKGEVAAQMFVDSTYHLLKNAETASFNIDEFIYRVMKTAHKNIRHFGLQKRPPIYPRSTGVIVVIQNGMMQWSHLGDSRTYLFREGQAHRRSLDHTRVELMRLKGDIEDSDSQSEASGRSGVSKCLGGKKKLPDIEITPPMPLHDGDVLLLCTDGIWSQLKEARLQALILSENGSLTERTSNLVDEAVKAAYPNSDNATALALCWHADNTGAETDPENDDITEVDTAMDHLRGLIDKYQ